jgi:DNA-binding GntR family transcriptional regulator
MATKAPLFRPPPDPDGGEATGLASLHLDLGRSGSVTDQVHEVLRKAIVDGTLPPKARISENSICKQFSVSRTPVRAAIQRLAEEGLVDVSPQRGSYVAPLRLEGLYDSHFVRRALELALLRETAPRWTREMSGELRGIIDDHARVAAARDLDGFFAEDERFHRALAGFSGRAGVWDAIQAAKIPMTRFHRYWAFPERLSDVLAEHRAVVDALDRGDGAGAEAALERHLDMVFVIYEKMPEDRKRALPFDTAESGTR